jgi:hypothetical protein
MIHRVATLVLSSSIMGLLLTPLAYIGIGALGGFAMAFALISLPLLLVCGLFLLYRYLRRPGCSPSLRRWLPAAEAIAWLLVAFFLVIASGFTLLTTAERIGLFCTLTLVMSVVAAPWMALRPSALATRVARWPTTPVAAAAAACTLVLLGGALAYLVMPSRFL